METPAIITPPATPSLAGQALAGAPEPAIVVPDAPVQEPIGQPELPSPQQAEGGGLDEALGTIDPAPEIETSLEPPEIPLEGNADPAALGSLESAAAGEAENLLGSAQAGVAEVSPEVVQPLALEETLTAPVLPEVQLADQAPRVEGMDRLAGYALGPLDRAAFDEQVGPSLQAATAEAQAELVQREQNFSQERTELQLAADAEAVAAQTEAQAKQRLEVDKGRQAIAAEQQRTLDQQQAAVDGALGELSVSREASAQEIDGRLAADRAAVDEVYAAAEADAQTEVAQGTAQADEAGQSAAEQAEEESWWDWAIDSWQSLVQAVAGKIIAIWEKVAEAVAGFLNRAIALASTIVSAAVAFVKQVLSAYFDLWTRLVDKLLGSLFPELAAAFKAWIDRLKAAVFAALDAVAAAYLQALRFIADKLVAGLYAALELYKAGVNAYLAMWETLQNSSWSDIGKALLSGLLTVVGIDPKEFFATFSKADEVVDDIIADPTLIGKRAVEALSLGIKQFGYNFIGNFTAAFVEWITGAARIIMPKTFSLAGIFDVVCQVLNLTYDYLRQKAVQHLGEGAVTAVEELFAAIKAFIAEGWAGLWKFVKDKLITLVDDVVIAMGSWLVEKAILVAGRWVAGLIATFGWSALVEGLIALWQFAMWVKDQFQRFWQIVKSTIDSVHEFVKGQIQPAADTIEGTLQDLIIPAIDLVAKLLNLGNIAKKVEQIIESVRQMIDEAIDSMVAFLKKKLGLGGEEEAEEEEEGVAVTTHKNIVQQALIEIDEVPERENSSETIDHKMKIAEQIIEEKSPQLEKGLKFTIKLLNETEALKKGNLVWQARISPNDTVEERAEKLDPPYEIDTGRPGDIQPDDLSKGSPMGSLVTPPTNVEISYVANVPMTTDKSPEQLAEMYGTQGFKGGHEEAKRRFSLVVGINAYDRLDKQSTESVTRAVGNVSWGNDLYPLRVFGFIWQPHWRHKGAAAVKIDEVREKYFNRQSDKEAINLLEKQQATQQSVIPYGKIRDRIQNSRYSKDFVDDLKNHSNNVYIHVGDADVVNLNAPPEGVPQIVDVEGPVLALFSRYDAILEETKVAGEYATIASGGYDFRLVNQGGDVPDKNALTALASRLDLAIRAAMARVEPSSVYFPEPNTIIKVQDDANTIRASFGTTSQESQAVVRNILNSRGGIRNVPMVFDIRAVVATGSDRFRIGDGTDVETEFVRGNFENLTEQHIRQLFNVDQSHASGDTWDKRIQFVFPNVDMGQLAELRRTLFPNERFEYNPARLRAQLPGFTPSFESDDAEMMMAEALGPDAIGLEIIEIAKATANGIRDYLLLILGDAE